ncbi:DUF4124 domain-containing protein [Mitsuaria sp. TWR114]|nr:DUF4124 domain-containing protein [Mitsuaria sp. TWR114]
MMNPRLPRRPLGVMCALALMALTSIAHAQWKWRDADGRTQYSDRPGSIRSRPRPFTSTRWTGASICSFIRSSRLVPPAMKRAPGRAASEPSSREKVERERKAQEDKARTEAMAENCRQAQNRQRMLESGVRLRSGTAGGESQPMTEQMRQDEIRQMQTVITANCK